MMTTICKLKFKDGSEVTAKIEEFSCQGRKEVRYSGAVDRLQNPLRMTKAGVLIAYFRQQAKDLQAELSIEESGKYEQWAE